jgi:Leucine-rich repeat (LRR) protein
MLTASPKNPAYDQLDDSHAAPKAYTFIRGDGRVFTMPTEISPPDKTSCLWSFFCGSSSSSEITLPPMLRQVILRGIPSENFYSLNLQEDAKPFTTEQEAFEEARRRHPNCALTMLTLNLPNLESQLTKIKAEFKEKRQSILDNKKYPDEKKKELIAKLNAVHLSHNQIEKISGYTALEQDYKNHEVLPIPSVASLNR